jgi:folate-binding protein YgfZ
LTSAQAKIVAHVLIYRAGPNIFVLDVAPGQAARVVEHLQRYHITEQLEISNRSAEARQFHMTGADVVPRMAALGGEVISALQTLDHAECRIASVSCQIRRNDALGLPGIDLLCPIAGSIPVQAAISTADIPFASEALYHVLRVEAGMPQYGIDIDDSNLPQEIGRTERTISFTKGCYIGQETVARIRTYGHVNRQLMGIRLAENRAVSAGARVYAAGKEVGAVTSSVQSLGLGTGIALGYVRRGHAEVGTTVEVMDADRMIPAEVVALPFVDYRSK